MDRECRTKPEAISHTRQFHDQTQPERPLHDRLPTADLIVGWID